MAVSTYSEPREGSPSSNSSLMRVTNTNDSLDRSFQTTTFRGRRSSSKSVVPVSSSPQCDACPHCTDICEEDNCFTCREKAMKGSRNSKLCSSGGPTYTMCEIRRHANASSAWLVAGCNVYDATEYINKHPGGAQSILKKCGGACDCTADLNFHSKSGKKVWEKYRIGKVRQCGMRNDKLWWMFWK